MTAPSWLVRLAEAASPAPPLLGAVVVVYVLLVAMLATVAALHPDTERRTAAYQVLSLFLGQGESSGPAPGSRP